MLQNCSLCYTRISIRRCEDILTYIFIDVSSFVILFIMYKFFRKLHIIWLLRRWPLGIKVWYFLSRPAPGSVFVLCRSVCLSWRAGSLHLAISLSNAKLPLTLSWLALCCMTQHGAVCGAHGAVLRVSRMAQCSVCGATYDMGSNTLSGSGSAYINNNQ